MDILTAIIAVLKEIIGFTKDAREDKKTGIETKIREKELDEKERLVQPATFEDVKRYDPKYRLIATRAVMGICAALAITTSAMVTLGIAKKQAAAQQAEANNQAADLSKSNQVLYGTLASQAQTIGLLSNRLDETSQILISAQARLERAEQPVTNLLIRIKELEAQNKIFATRTDEELLKEVYALPKESGITFLSTSGKVTPPFVVTNYSVYQPIETSVAEGGEARYEFITDDTVTNEYVILIWVNATNAATNLVYVNVDDEGTGPDKIWDIPRTKGFERKIVTSRVNKDNVQSVPYQKNFRLGPGAHQLIIRGISGNVYLNLIMIHPVPRPPSSFQMNPI